jgi:hypothetical protein
MVKLQGCIILYPLSTDLIDRGHAAVRVCMVPSCWHTVLVGGVEELLLAKASGLYFNFVHPVDTGRHAVRVLQQFLSSAKVPAARKSIGKPVGLSVLVYK